MNKLKSILTNHRRLLGPIALALAVTAIFWVVNSPGTDEQTGALSGLLFSCPGQLCIQTGM